MQLFLSISGIILSAILLWFNARENKSTIYLGISFLFGGLFTFTQYALFHSGSVTLAAFVLVNSGIIPFLAGPFIYFYIRGILKDDPDLKIHDWWHLLPVIVFLVMATPFLISSWSFKKEVAGKLITALSSQDYLNPAFLGNKLLSYMVFVLSKVMVLGYVLWSAFLLLSFLKHNRDKEVFFRLQSTVKWIKAFLGIIIIMMTGHIWFMIKTFVFGNLSGIASFYTIQIIMGFGPLAILLLTFFSPGILYGLPRIPRKSLELKIPGQTTDMETTPEKATRIQLETGYLQNIGREMDHCMEKFQPYTHPGFSLAELAVLIHIPTHHLSYYFREEKKQSFTDYRNEWRVNHAKNLIMEGKTGEMTLEAIGLLSGFPNRDSFRAAFQRFEGITPAVFIARKQK